MTSTNRRAPTHLSTPARGLWRAIQAAYRLEEADFRLLEAACTLWDRAREARLLVKEEGAFVLDRFSQRKTHPAVEVERQSLLAFARILRELGVHADEIPEARIPRGRDYA